MKNDAKPLLLPRTVLSTDTVSRAGTVITIEDTQEWARFARLLGLCDGRHTCAQIAIALSVNSDVVSNILSSLESTGFIWWMSDYTSIPTEVFHAEFKRWLPFWVDQMYDQPCWQGLYDGTVSANVLVGWALENMHYTRTVMSHMPLAVRYANDATGEAVQFKHLHEEWDHYYMFLDACRAAGVPENLLKRGCPLASTLSITLFMRCAARQGTLVYNACEALLESTTENGRSVVNFYEEAGERLGLPHEFTRELIRHVTVDKEFEHIDIFDQLLAHQPMLSNETVVKIFDYCQRLRDLFVLWNTEIYEFYSGTSHLNHVARSEAISQAPSSKRIRSAINFSREISC